jgi:hypothetical protein
MHINLNKLNLMTGAEASERWGYDRRYVNQLYSKYPERFKRGTVIRIGNINKPTIVISKQGMEYLTGMTEEESKIKNKH